MNEVGGTPGDRPDRNRQEEWYDCADSPMGWHHLLTIAAEAAGRHGARGLMRQNVCWDVHYRAAMVGILVLAGCDSARVASPTAQRTGAGQPPPNAAASTPTPTTPPSMNLPFPLDDQVEWVDLSGQPVRVVAWQGDSVLVCILVRTDCPIANRYAPEIKRLAEAFGERGVRFALVYPDAAEDPSKIQQHLKDYGYVLPAFRDTTGRFTQATGVTVTPEALLIRADHQIVYRGRIDDWYAAFGQARPAPSDHTLQDALLATLSGQLPAQFTAPAIGCYIPRPR